MIWHSEKKETVAMELQSPPKKGLTEMIVGLRLEDYGKNTVTERKKKSNLKLFMGKLFAPVSLILIIVSIFTAFIALSLDNKDYMLLIHAGIILTSSVLWAAVSAHRERMADLTVMKLQKMRTGSAKVLRNKVNKVIPVESLVPGDIVRLEAGDIIPADGRLLLTTSFMCDESLITGSTKPTLKDCDALLPEETPVEDRVNMVYSGTVALTGRAMMIVTETGFKTQAGIKYGSNIDKINSRTQPVQNANSICSAACWIVLAVCVGLFGGELISSGFSNLPKNSNDIMNWLMSDEVYNHIVFALTLAVCAIPFGLPQSTLYSLVHGAKKYGNDGVMLRSFKKADVIGCTSVICTDKTGTLTKNQMSVARAWPLGDIPSTVDEGFWSDEMKYLMQCSALCCDSRVTCDDDGNEQIVGDSTEAAIISAYVRDGNDIDKLFEQYPRVTEIPFDSTRKLMTVVHDVNGLYLVVTKGAPDVLVSKCVNADVDEINMRNAELCSEGLRVIAVAVHALDRLPEKITPETMENELTFIGLIGVLDPHREDVAEAVEACSEAGIRTVMITGDHPATAVSVARRLGIMGEKELAITGEELAGMSDKKLAKSLNKYSVFARITPDDKVRLIKAWQAKGNCVLMTAGGLGDAPALHSADISCTVEETATDVAVDAADVTLSENNFVNIFSLVKQGRLLKNNIAKLTEYCIGCSIAQTLAIVFGKLLFGVSVLKMLPVMLINFMVFWLLQPAFAYEPDEKNMMRCMPRLNDGSSWDFFEKCRALLGGISGALTTLAAYVTGCLTSGSETGVTMAFAVMAAGLVIQALNSRSNMPLCISEIMRNRRMVVSIILIIAVSAMFISVPYVNTVFGLVALNGRRWAEIGIFVTIQLAVCEIPKLRSYLNRPAE